MPPPALRGRGEITQAAGGRLLHGPPRLTHQATVPNPQLVALLRLLGPASRQKR